MWFAGLLNRRWQAENQQAEHQAARKGIAGGLSSTSIAATPGCSSRQTAYIEDKTAKVEGWVLLSVAAVLLVCRRSRQQRRSVQSQGHQRGGKYCGREERRLSRSASRPRTGQIKDEEVSAGKHLGTAQGQLQAASRGRGKEAYQQLGRRDGDRGDREKGGRAQKGCSIGASAQHGFQEGTRVRGRRPPQG